MFLQTILMIFTIICVSSCQVIAPVVLPIPKFKPIKICPPVFIPVDAENSIYKVHCRCADYDMNKVEYISDFKKAPIEMCDRAQGILLEDFNEELEVTMIEIQEWYADMKGVERKVKRYLKKGKYSKAKKYLWKRAK